MVGFSFNIGFLRKERHSAFNWTLSIWLCSHVKWGIRLHCELSTHISIQIPVFFNFSYCKISVYWYRCHVGVVTCWCALTRVYRTETFRNRRRKKTRTTTWTKPTSTTPSRSTAQWTWAAASGRGTDGDRSPSNGSVCPSFHPLKGPHQWLQR